MIKGIFLAARGLNSGNQHISVVANNLANINTNGFKRETPFSELLDAAGNFEIRQVTDHKQGELISTSNPLDLAIKGEGYFTIETENGKFLTRDGRFRISSDGFLVNYNGDKVLGQGGEISFGENIFQKEQSVSISKTGEVKMGDTIIDKLNITSVEDTRLLKKAGGNYFSADEDEFQELEEQKFEINQGFLESANVNPVEEMEAMIRLNKDYQSSSKVVSSLDDTLEKANQIGKV